jgi:hypothetical protein
MENQPTFTALRHIVSCQQHLNSSPEMIFPLLCPKREYDWIETWKGQIIYSESGFAEQDCIFSTDLPGGKKEIWTVDRYEKNELIQFVRFTESRVIRYRITLTDNSDGTTKALWGQTITALNEEGNAYIENFKDNDYQHLIHSLEKMLNHYLETGEMLKKSEDGRRKSEVHGPH